ncbi:MAG TPA: bifunctional isocitrate dehydrogenase kinase/phosphatase [Chloroflexia bacterium]|nr:bifunctional isocitrate dehydrogenase kinase/phosphatase [Chloroflexia bacterium]
MTADLQLSGPVADTILAAFATYHDAFRAVTHRAKERFERGEWLALHQDSEERLDLYKQFTESTVADVKAQLGAGGRPPALWAEVKAHYTTLIAARPDRDLAESAYNSVVIRVAATVGIDPGIEFVGNEFPPPLAVEAAGVYTSYLRAGSTADLVRAMLADYPFAGAPFDLDENAARVADQIDAHLTATGHADPIHIIELAKPVFYRGKGAYLVGRICSDTGHIPLVLALLHVDSRIAVDAVLLTEDEVSIIFSFARSYFHVELEKPRAMVQFLKSILPRKPVAELYISLGYNKHGKTELYRDLHRHLASSTDQFEIARGERGMVMVVFTLPSYDVVFKIIKDSFDYPKSTTRREVMSRYLLVFRHDRGGRLVDAQEFEHLRFEKSRFAPALLDELLRVAANSVHVEDDDVVIKHLYTERRLTPLNLYLKEAPPDKAHDAVIDYGQAIKDLAATNIFPGDLLLKNFGVTRHGRVVFYDYDELCLLTDCNFRHMPQARDADEDVSAEPWFSVAENDVFPEELGTFLGLPPPQRAIFTAANPELFDVPFWADLCARHAAGEVIDIFPYKESKRLLREV